MEKIYLGDSVYVEINESCFSQLILTTENGGPPSNKIYLERSVWKALEVYVKEMERINKF